MAQGISTWARLLRLDNASDIKEKATDQFEKMADKATDQFSHMADQAENVASRVADQGREAGERVQEVAGNFKGAVDRSVKDQPMATLAVAAVDRLRARRPLEVVSPNVLAKQKGALCFEA